MFARQDAIDVAVVEFPAPHRVAIVVQIFCDRSRAHRLAGQSGAGQFDDQADGCRLVFAREQLLALLASLNSHDAGFIAERHRTTVPVPRLRIAAPIAARERGCIVGVLLVHHRDEPAHHPAVGIVAHPLDDGYQLHPGLGELVLGGDLSEQAPGESAQRVNDDDVHRAGRSGRQCDHPVELPALQLSA
nr:hypothetical protein [Sphingomonas sp.]